MKPIYHFTYAFGVLFMSMTLLAEAQIAETQTEPNIIEHIMKGDTKALSAALSNGADVNQQTKEGNTALMAAAKIGDRLTLDLLLEKNADVNMRNNAGATALMIAAKYGNPHVVTELLNQGADPTIQNKNGYAASNFAWGYKHYEIYDQLKLAESDFIAQKKIKDA